MSERVITVGGHLSSPLCSLVLAWSPDGRLVIYDSAKETGPQIVMDPATLAEWAGRNVEANVQERSRTYGNMHAGLGVHARLVTTGDVISDFDRKKGVWCIWHKGQAKTRFDLERHETDALVALMGSKEFLEFIDRAPATSTT